MILSPLSRRDIVAGGRRWSLLSLREEILSEEYGDIRALFALNWGMKGCAPLASAPLTTRNMNELLETQTRRFVQDPTRGRYEKYERRFHASPLIKEYWEEFERQYSSPWAFLRRFSRPYDAEHMEKFPPKFFWLEFDESLNDVPRK